MAFIRYFLSVDERVVVVVIVIFINIVINIIVTIIIHLCHICIS